MAKGRNRKNRSAKSKHEMNVDNLASTSDGYESTTNSVALKNIGKEDKQYVENLTQSSDSIGSSLQNHIVHMSDNVTQKRQGLKKERASHINGTGLHKHSAHLRQKFKEKDERERIVLWRRPITTLHYFVLESIVLLQQYLVKLWHNKKLVLLTTLVLGALYVASITAGSHQMVLDKLSTKFWWCGWWVWLGILSSVGLGTGLHTFLLYLGPHIASVTMAAYSCNSVNFPSPPYPDEIVCPDDGDQGIPVSIFNIMTKVRLEAFMWGAGTALGELPPYFMARGARLSGYDPDDEEMAEFEELQRLKERPEDMSWLDRLKLSVEKLVEKVGFFGILACASIPNPLFDLAGITCGHFLVPFWTFFGATLIGKAIIKMHIQKMFVIIAFNDSLLQKAVHLLGLLPVLGKHLQDPFKIFLQKQQQKFKRKTGSGVDAQGGNNILAWLFEKLILLMIVYFVLSIVNSFAQSYHKRLHKKETRSKSAKD